VPRSAGVRSEIKISGQYFIVDFSMHEEVNRDPYVESFISVPRKMGSTLQFAAGCIRLLNGASPCVPRCDDEI
jgi:hypothetical protein